ncbi:GDSL-type esterase/lipase family protein [Marisediminicola senii]|uniref:GDSL-type esterase/lipase family protein n=1 Tax=Marisediminicola senii TaxID=2711233 RepID=UPI0013EAA5D3|nr:GDSL-type esterase/lipase family protein [Marisediminicola senii]
MTDSHVSDSPDPGDRSRDDEKDTVVFLGDSLTEAGAWGEWFPDLNVINMGVGGSTTDDLLGRLDDIVAVHPDEIIVLIGTNDLGTRQTVEHLVRNIESLCVSLRRELPGSRMLVQSVLPRGREFAGRIQDANIHLRQFSRTVRAQFLDLWPALALEDGELNPAYSDDRLHLTDAGYEAWLAELRPALVRLREQPPMTTPISVIRTDQYSRPNR